MKARGPIFGCQIKDSDAEEPVSGTLRGEDGLLLVKTRWVRGWCRVGHGDTAPRMILRVPLATGVPRTRFRVA